MAKEKRTYADRKKADPNFVSKQYAYMKRRRRKIKQTLVDEAGGKCIRCGYDECIAALEFHHRDPSEKEIRLTDRSMEKLRAEAAKCDLLCANCHRIVHSED